jgi:predicted DNA-binding protein
MPTRRKAPGELKISTGVRLKPDVRARLEELAASRRWTIAGYIEWLIEQHLEDLDAHPTKPPTSRTRS